MWSDLLHNISIWNLLSAKLDVECVCSRDSWCVENAHCAVSVLHNVDVDVATTCATNMTCDVTKTCVRRVDIDDALLAHGDCRADTICKKKQQNYDVMSLAWLSLCI